MKETSGQSEIGYIHQPHSCRTGGQMKKEEQTKSGCQRAHAAHARAKKGSVWKPIPHPHPTALAGPVPLGHLEAE